MVVNSEPLSSKTPNSIARRGWVLVEETQYSDLPVVVAEIFARREYQCPRTSETKTLLWRKIERLFYKYARRLSEQYSVEFEDLAQEAYLFYEALLRNYKPLYRRPMREGDGTEEPSRYSRIYTYDSEGRGWAWKLYKLEPYLCTNMYQRIRDYAQRIQRYNRRLYGIDSVYGESGSGVMDNVIHHLSEAASGGELTYLQVERRILNDSLEGILRELLHAHSATDRLVAELFFRQGLSEREIYKMLTTAPAPISIRLATIKTNVATIRERLRSHETVRAMLDEFAHLGISEEDVLG